MSTAPNYLISADGLAALEARVMRLARQRRIPSPALRARPASARQGKDMFWVTVVPAPTPRLGDYELVGVVEHRASGNALRALAQVDIRPYQSAAPTCDHCQADRKRNETFIVMGRGGVLRQVGRQCLREYVDASTADAAEAIAVADLLRVAIGSAEDWDEQDGARDGRIHLPTFLTYVAEVAMRDGWVSASEAKKSGGKATFHVALAVMPPRGDAGWEPREAARSVAHRALDWVRDLGPQDNDYVDRLRGTCEVELVAVKDAGIAASLMWAYRERGRLKLKEAEAPPEPREESRRDWSANEYQRAAVDIEVRRLEQKERGLDAAAAMLECTAEFERLIRRQAFHSDPVEPELMAAKAGDALWYAAVALDNAGIKLGDVLDLNVRRLRERYGRRVEGEQ
ncbi:MAG: nucleoside triphosphate pyrophosphohydrolase family protein [Candidatus Dormibacteria bacterium]